MKKLNRMIAVAGIALSLAAVTPMVASADTTTTVAHQGAGQAWKVAREAIGTTYKSAVAAARASFTAAMSAATTHDQKVAAHQALKAAIAAAQSARTAAIAALGPKPVHTTTTTVAAG
jgi:hypothetical protein